MCNDNVFFRGGDYDEGEEDDNLDEIEQEEVNVLLTLKKFFSDSFHLRLARNLLLASRICRCCKCRRTASSSEKNYYELYD